MTNEELLSLIQLCEVDDLISLDIDLIVHLARAELSRNAAASEPVQVPAEFVAQLAREAAIPVAITGGNVSKQQLQDFADKVAQWALGRK